MIDRVNGVAYVNISERADQGLAEQWADKMGYKELVTFRYECMIGTRGPSARGGG